MIVRCRPFSEKEAAAGYKKVLQIDTTRATVELLDASTAGEQASLTQSKAPNKAPPQKGAKPQESSAAPRLFTYDGSFDEQTSQETVYASTASRIVDSVLDGFNGTILAYGKFNLFSFSFADLRRRTPP